MNNNIQNVIMTSDLELRLYSLRAKRIGLSTEEQRKDISLQHNYNKSIQPRQKTRFERMAEMELKTQVIPFIRTFQETALPENQPDLNESILDALNLLEQNSKTNPPAANKRCYNCGSPLPDSAKN